MNLSLYFLFKAIIGLIRLICLPIKLLHIIIYGSETPKLIGYAWYSKQEYSKLVNSSEDDKAFLIPTYELWREEADEGVKELIDSGDLVIKINIRIKELKSWLRKHHLPNTVDNREVFSQFQTQQKDVQ